MSENSALAGLRVLDLSRFISGPFCAMQLGDLGADVVKVERKDVGEDCRPIGPHLNGESLYIMVHNRNKRGLAIDYRAPGASEVIKKLCANVDILIENFRPGTMEAMGLDWDTLHAINPRLIMVRISGFGSEGPASRKPCFDVIAQAASGLMHMTGQPSGPPTMAGTFIIDYSTGLYATIATLAALQARHQTGLGQVVKANLLASAMSFLMTAIPEYLLFGTVAGRQGTRDRYAAPANNFRCKDNIWIHISAGNDNLFCRFARAANLDDMIDDPRFSVVEMRMKNVDALEERVSNWTSSLPSAEVLKILDDAEVPCAKIADISDVVNNKQVEHMGQIINLKHPVSGNIPMQGFPISLSDTPTKLRKIPPKIGEHTEQILSEWGEYSEAEIAALKATKII
jgi:crotonobetainyl-CoA:carnitine CoA-transferase CaiB-like acyl-CoA transferase